MNNFGAPHISVESTPKEPVELLEDGARRKLQELYPEAKQEALISIRGSFLYDVLSNRGISPFLDRFSPEEQVEKIKSVGATSVEEGVKIILENVPEDVIVFYRKKIGNPGAKVDILDL